LVRAVVQAGSVHTVVRVKAQATDPSSGQTISSQSEQLVVTTGLPDQDSFSLSASRRSIDGNCDGESTTINIRAADRYNNPVPAGTAISFTTEGGKINGQCTTGDPLADTTAEAGVCPVLLSAQNPRPADGRVTVLATAIGEESFTDMNGDGFYGPGDRFTAAEDLPEAFLDADFDGVRDASETFLDFNDNQVFDPANGQFDGYVCNAPGVNCSSAKINVRDDLEIAFADTRSAPVISGVPATITVVAKGTATISGTVRDANGNSLPTGTRFQLATTSGSVLAPATLGPFNTTRGDPFAFTIQAPDTAVDGSLTLSVIIPGSACYASFPYTKNYPLDVQEPAP
jgi:hypothetical protein